MSSEVSVIDSSIEKKIKALIEASIMANPSLKDRLNVAVCVQYLQLPDSTYGWDSSSYKTPGAMPIEYKIACLLPTIANGLPPGSIFWLGNRPYASAAALSFVAARDVVSTSGIKFRPFTADEKSMFGIGEKDMAVIASRDVIINGHAMTLEGYGVLGWDESQPNSKGNYKVAMEKTRDRMQFVRTRAIRDMWNRHISISGVPSEDDHYETPEILDITPNERPSAVAALKNGHPDNAQPIIDEVLQAKFSEITETVLSLGGSINSIIGDEQNLAICIKLLEEWIDSNQNPDPEPPTPTKQEVVEPAPEIAVAPTTDKPITARRTRKPRAETVSKESVIVEQGPIDVVKTELVPPSPPAPGPDEMDPINYIDDSVESEEYEEMAADESLIDEFDIPEHLEPRYIGTTEQKQMIRQAVQEVGLPHTAESLASLAGAMQGKVMSKLIETAQELKTKLAPEKPKPQNTKEPERVKLKHLIDKLNKIGAKTMDICGENPWNVWEYGTTQDVKAATLKLETWYERFLTK